MDHNDHTGHGHHAYGSAAFASEHADHIQQMSLAGGHEHDSPAAVHGWSAVAWSTAAAATLRCLTGCAIGEVLGMVLGMVLGTAFGWHNAVTVVVSVVLAFVFGDGLTMRGVLRAAVGGGGARHCVGGGMRFRPNVDGALFAFSRAAN